MSPPFSPRLEILPPPQLRLWAELAEVPEEFVLYGGTAVALHLGHRQSIDFDFFGSKPLDPFGLLPSLPFLAGATVTQREPNTLSCTVDRGGAVKLSFFGIPAIRQLEAPLVAADNRLRIASLLDLAGTKLSVVQVRAEAKDYIDIDAILASGKVTLPMGLAAAGAIYGSAFNPQNALKALSYFEDGNLRRLPEPTKDRLVKAAAAVDLNHLPSIELSIREQDLSP